MKPALVLAFLLSQVAPAFAQPYAMAAISEGRHYLTPCEDVLAADRERCSRNQGIFLDSYVLAKGGSVVFAGVISQMLGTDLEPLASYPGIRHDRHFACVWKKAQMMIIDDKEKERLIRGPWDANCSHLDIDELVRISDDMVKTMGSYLRQLKWQPPL